MKTSSDIRLQCILLANNLAMGKNIKPEEVVQQAQSYLNWVEQRETVADLEPLRTKYAIR